MYKYFQTSTESFDLLEKKLIFTLTIWVFFIFIGLVLDIVADVTGTKIIPHILLESVVMFLLLLLISFLIWLNFKVNEKSKLLAVKNERIQNQLIEAQSQIDNLLEDLRSSLFRKFEAWNLSEAEEDIGILILRGFSFNDIALKRKVSERTVRQQAQSVYKKSGYANRSDFSSILYELIH